MCGDVVFYGSFFIYNFLTYLITNVYVFCLQFATVFKAKDLKEDRIVAVKKVSFSCTSNGAVIAFIGCGYEDDLYGNEKQRKLTFVQQYGFCV